MIYDFFKVGFLSSELLLPLYFIKYFFFLFFTKYFIIRIFPLLRRYILFRFKFD